jgi:dipeptidyl aminopeptidase/acylaminoacyl peptidase
MPFNTIIKASRTALAAAALFIGSASVGIFANAAEISMPTLEDYYKDYPLLDIDLSPDGSKLAVVFQAQDESYQLGVYDLNNKFAPLSIVKEQKNLVPDSVNWLTNDRLGLGVLAERKVSRFRIGFKRIIAINADGSNPIPVLSDQRNIRDNYNVSRIISYLPQDPDHIIMTAVPKYLALYKVNINDGTSTKIVEGKKNTIAFKVNKQGEPSLRWDYNRRAREITMFTWIEETRKWKEVTTLKLSALEDELDRVLANHEGDETIIMLDRKDGSEFISLHRYDIRTDEYKEVVYEHPDYDLQNVIENTYTGKVLGVSYISNRLQYHFFDPVLQEVQTNLEATFQNGAVQIREISTDRNRFLVFVSQPWRPATVYLFERSLNKINRLFDFAPHFENQAFTQLDEIQYRHPDGTEINCYLTFPAHQKDEKLPLIIMPHGGPHARDSLRYDEMVQYLATRGYMIFQPNFRGSTGYGRTFEEAGYMEYGGKMIEDIAAGARALIKSERIDESRICAVGSSYGGYAALMLSVQTDMLSCAISINGVTDWSQVIKFDTDELDDEDRKDVLDYYKDRTGIPGEDDEALSAISLWNKAEKFNIPILLVQTWDDRIVSPKNARELRARLSKKKKDVTLKMYDHGGHSLRGDTEEKALLEIEHFLYKHIANSQTLAPTDKKKRKKKRR